MSDEKELFEYLLIYSFLFLNEKGSCLYNAYNRNEVENKLVIKIDQDDRAPKFSVADDISEVYGLFEIHECINEQKPLRAIIDINATQKDIKVNRIKSDNILKELVIVTLSDSSKCSYHLLYALILLIDYNELKAFTELVYTLTGKKFSRFIDRGLPGQNFNLYLISSAKKGCMKRILLSSITNGWNKPDHTRVQPPSNLSLKVRPRMLSIKKNNSSLKIIIGHDILQKCIDLVLQKYSNYFRDYTIEEKNSKNFVYFNQKAPLECPQCKCIHDKDQWWFSHVCASNRKFIVKCFRQGSDKPEEVFELKYSGFPKAFVKMPYWVKYSKTLMATEIYKERYVKLLPNEGDIYVESP
ncbi:15824_t:CDS:2 [Cetraspora pellucida]|uniref:15824_t:CDS:1 n=1 Tax=Cetraspora pellucida TaxID=1433469 RepID=A0A9N8VBP3_9GLOM|nr:15824_t:CDS:2 [Cetraspora pellucida]